VETSFGYYGAIVIKEEETARNLNAIYGGVHDLQKKLLNVQRSKLKSLRP